MHRYILRIFVYSLVFFFAETLWCQGNKVNIVASAPKNITICGLTDTARVSVFNISASTVTGITVTLTLPTGVRYLPGSVTGTGVTELNITNLNKPIFSASSLSIGKNFSFRYRIRANCDLIPLVSGPTNPSVGVRVDYSGNYDAALSLPFTASIPSLGYNSITNQTFTGNVGDKFVRRVTFTNFGKGPLPALRLVRVKGKDLSLKSENGFSHRYTTDSVITTITKADILKVGNKDTFLDQNESIAISDTFTILACTFLSTSYDLAWGCDGKFCQVVKNTASVFISTAAPNLQVTVSSNVQLVYNNTHPSKYTLRIVNNGLMKSLKSEVIVFQTLNPGVGYYNYELSRIDSSSIRLQKGWKGSSVRVYTDTFLTNLATPCWPAGSMGGFRLRLQDLLPKDTLFITWDVYRCANANCNAGFYESGWGYKVTYQNQCSTALTTNNQWGVGNTYSGGAVTPYAPTDLQQNEVKPFRYTFTGMGNLPLHSSAAIRIDLVLPNTLTHSLLNADFYIDHPNLTAIWYPDSIRKINDTIRAYMGRVIPFGLTNAELTVRLKGVCVSGSGNRNLPLTLIYSYNPNRNAHPNLWLKPICNTVSVKVHCSNVCSQGGMLFRNFEVYRSNYGSPDNNNDGLPDASGSLDFLKIRRERIMFGDTLTTVFRGRPMPAPGITNWRFGYAESVVTNGDYISVLDATLELYKGNVKITPNCNSVKWRKVTSGNNATFYFNFSIDSIWKWGCLSASYRYIQNDSLCLIVRYKVNKNRGQTSQLMTFSNRYYLATANNPAPSQTYQCDTFSGNCILYGFIFHNWGTDNINYATCNELTMSQNFYLGIGNCCTYGGGNIFPFEYRNWGRPVSMKLIMPAGLKLNRTSFIQNRTAGTNNTVAERKDTIPFRRGSSYIFDFVKYYKDSGGRINYSDDGFHGTFSYTVFPTCEIIPGFRYPIHYEFIYQRRGALGNRYDTVTSQQMNSPDYFTYTPPNFGLQPAVPIIYGTKDTVEWEVRFSNPSTTLNANNIWLSPQNNGNIRIVQIRDWARDTIIKPVNDIYRAGLLSAGQTRSFKVRAVFSRCTPDSILIFGGWNCQGYPVNFTSNICPSKSAKLYLEPLNTRLNITLSDSVSTFDLCYPNRMTLTIDNVQSVTAQQLKARITLPIGMDLIPGSNFIKYPHKSAAVTLSNPVLLSGTTYEWDLSKVAPLSAGLPGTADTNKNKIIITFRVKTNCDYASGSFINARALSNIKCGDPIPANTAYTNPLEIRGITRPYYTQVKSWTDSILPCEKPAFSKIRFVVLGPVATGTDDWVEVLLPPGITRDPAYFLPVRNAPNKDSFTTRNFNGATLLSWRIPANIQPGDSSEFNLKLLSASSATTCGPADLLFRTVVSKQMECVPENKICNIKVISGSVLGQPITDKSNLQIINGSVSTRLISSDSERVQLNYQIKNTGKYTSSALPILVRYHYDNDGNGKWSSGDLWLGTDTFRKSLKKDSLIVASRTLRIRAGQSCAMLAVIDSSACACRFGQWLFAAPPLTNAGRDTALCAGSPWRMGDFAPKWFQYSWDRADLLDSTTIANPIYTPSTSLTSTDTQFFMLTTNRGLCTTRDGVMLVVRPLPAVTMANSNVGLCDGASVVLSNTVNNGKTPYRWRWSPATYLSDSAMPTPLATPKTNIKYTLLVTDNFGCAKSDTVRVTVNPNPVARFFWPVTCAGNNVIVSDSSMIAKDSIANLFWSTTGFDTFGLKVINLKMNGASRLPLTLSVFSNKGCGDTITRMVDVKALPKVNFTIPFVCNGDSSRFVNLSSIDSGSITSWSWNFGDGQISAVKAPVHRYADTGKRTVMLAAISNYGCTDTIRKFSRVFPIPQSQFTFGNVCSGDSFVFADISKLFGDTLKSRNWNLGVMGVATQAVVKRVNKAWGKYPVALTIETIHGCKHTSIDTARVYPLPNLAFTADSVCEGITTSYFNSSQIPQGSIVKYNWKLGDGNISTATAPKHNFAKQGVYSAWLKATSNKGCVDSVTNTVIVYAPAWPVFAVNNLCLRQSLSSTATNRGAGVPQNYKWYLGNGDSVSGPNLNYTYTTHGTFSLRMRMITDKGCVRDSVAPVTVHPLPLVNFTAINPCKDDSLVFTAQTGIALGNAGVPQWSFSSGQTATGSPVRRIFDTPGNYTAKLKHTSDKGCMDSLSLPYIVGEKVIVKYSVKDVCLEEKSIFIDSSYSIQPVNMWNWDFGNGFKSTQNNPAYTYNMPGKYNTRLQITTLPGCFYSGGKSTIVHPKPKAYFTHDPDQGTIVNPNITFTDKSQGADSLWYVFSTGYKTRSRNFMHSLPDSGIFTITQYVSTTFGCRDSFTKQVVINYMYTQHVPTAFTPNEDNLNEGFAPAGMGIKWYAMKIYSRWGEKIYETRDSKSWNGTYNGEPVPEGVYVVLMELKDHKGRNHYYKGTVQILRKP